MSKRIQKSVKQLAQKKVKLDAKREQHHCQELEDIANMIRLESVQMTDASKSGHPTSCASLADLLACMFFSPYGMRLDVTQPNRYEAERLVLSKGHAAPALYSAWHLAGYLTKEEILTLRQIDSRIEGHPMPNMPFVDVATGSLGQGLGVAAGLAYSHQYLDHNDHRSFAIIGDGEAQEGSIWEAAHFAGHYKLRHLVAFLDCNRMGQSFLLGDNSPTYLKRFQAFGWDTTVIDGHDVIQLQQVLKKSLANTANKNGKPIMVICRTLKGKGLGEKIENNLNFHGKPLGAHSQETQELLQSQIQSTEVRMQVNQAGPSENKTFKSEHGICPFKSSHLPETEEKISATREIYGATLKAMGAPSVDTRGQLVVLDADMRNSTFSGEFAKSFPERFVECFIAEQNMVSVGAGLACRDKVVFMSTFAAFLSRAYDQLRMAGVSQTNLKVCGSHVGCSIGEDGTSQMGLEDMAMFRALPNSTVLYPSDRYAMEQAVYLAAHTPGIVYIRSNRAQLKSIYSSSVRFAVGKAHLVKDTPSAKALVVAMGVTLHQALAAAEQVDIKVMDLFSVKPVDKQALQEQGRKSQGKVIVVEDHYQQGGSYEAICAALSDSPDIQVIPLCVNRIPKSGKTQELLELCGISTKHIVRTVHAL